MPSLEQAISTEAAALARGRKPAIPLQREEERERGGFGYRAEDEDAVGRGRCSRVCREVKTSSGNDCDPGPKMHSRAPLELIVL